MQTYMETNSRNVYKKVNGFLGGGRKIRRRPQKDCPSAFMTLFMVQSENHKLRDDKDRIESYRS